MNVYMERSSVPPALRRRVREYLHHAAFTQQADEDIEGFNRLSPTLRSDVIHESPSFTWLWRVWIFKDTDVEFIVSIPHCMVANVYAPFELPERGRLYVLHKGVVMNGGTILTTGRWWGEDMIVHSEMYRKQLVARALTFLETYSIDRGTLYRLAEAFPEALQRLRLRAVIMALTRKLLLERKVKEGARDRQTSD
jgi:hypothetical protein